MPRVTKEQMQEIVTLEITRGLADRIKFLASYEKRSVEDFLTLAIEEGKQDTGDDISHVVLKVWSSVYGKHEIWAKVNGNPNLLLEWLAAQPLRALDAAPDNESEK